MATSLLSGGDCSPDLEVVFGEARCRLGVFDFDLDFELPADDRFFAIVGIVCVEEREQHSGFGVPDAERNGDGVMKRTIFIKIPIS